MKRLALLLALASTGCWSTTISSGKPVGETPPEWDSRWHSGLLFGTVDLDGPYDLKKVCPDGWAQVQTKTSPLNGLLIFLTFDIYSTQTVTVRCASASTASARP